jgi:hypothetical protein
MIDVLKKEIEEKIGREIKTRGDCELVSVAIYETFDIEISNSTIRRFFGLVPNTKPNNKTLNLLTQFIGYKDFIHFSKNHQYKEKINLSHIIYETVADGNAEKIVSLVKTTKHSQENFIGFIVILLRELLHNENYILINRLFKLDALSFNSFSYSEVLYLGNSVGLLLSNKPKLDIKLLNNLNFLECIYSTYVDYSNLNKYYGDWSETIKRNKREKEITVFSSAILELRNFLNNDPINKLDVDFVYNKQTHPILKSRLLALKLLNKNSENNLEILDDYYNMQTKSGVSIDYAYELFTTTILTKNLQIMSHLIDNNSWNLKFYYQKSHLNSYFLMCLFYYKLTGNPEKEREYIELFRLRECQHSYKEFINLIHHVYLFNTTAKKSEERKIRNVYLTLSKKLSYPYFSEEFLLNYFKQTLP